MSPTSSEQPSSHHNVPLEADLLALLELTPPSPILSPSGLDVSWSWSDIQIELACSIDGEAVQDSGLSHSICRNSGLDILTSSSISTVGTAGTFGPTFKRHKTPGAFNSSDSMHSRNSGLSTLDEDVIASRSGSSEDASLSLPVSPHLRSLIRPTTTTRLSSALNDRIYAVASEQTQAGSEVGRESTDS